MTEATLEKLHRESGARWTEVNGVPAVDHFGDPMAEYWALRKTVGILDLSFRSRICITGADRRRFLHSQVTNDVNGLKPGQGCYAAIVNAKAKLQSDANIYDLGNEMLLDFEPGLTSSITAHFAKYVIADDVQVVDVAPHYGLISVQGPKAIDAITALELVGEVPSQLLSFTSFNDPALGDIYCMNNRRGIAPGFDLFVPIAALEAIFKKAMDAAKQLGGLPCGWQALEMVRIEAGIPRFMQDMGPDNLAPEAGIESRAISYTKGCYIGQEVISRIRTYGQVAKALRGLVLADTGSPMPKWGERIFYEGKDAGFITSALASPAFGKNIAMGYVRREHNQIGTELQIGPGGWRARIVSLPFDLANL